MDGQDCSVASRTRKQPLRFVTSCDRKLRRHRSTNEPLLNLYTATPAMHCLVSLKQRLCKLILREYLPIHTWKHAQSGETTRVHTISFLSKYCSPHQPIRISFYHTLNIYTMYIRLVCTYMQINIYLLLSFFFYGRSNVKCSYKMENVWACMHVKNWVGQSNSGISSYKYNVVSSQHHYCMYMYTYYMYLRVHVHVTYSCVHFQKNTSPCISPCSTGSFLLIPPRTLYASV